MNRIQFLIVTILSGIVALCIFLQIIFVRLLGADQSRLRDTEQALQAGQNDFTHLQQIATRVAQLAQQQNDEALRDLLARQNIQIKANPDAATSTPPAPAPAPPAPAPSSTH
jgi:HAMP domain-containing protein